MRPADAALAALVAAIWGFAFVTTRVALESFSPAQLTALRFIVAAAPVLFLGRPNVPWRLMLALGMFLFVGQFLSLFFAMANGMPPGLASVLVHIQAFFTVGVAVVVLKDRPTPRQIVGMVLAFAGLAAIATTVGGELTVFAFALTLFGAMSWAIGNVILKRLGDVDMLPLMVWLSIVPPLPALLLSAAVDGDSGLADAVGNASWLGIASVIYLGTISTVFAYAVWGRLLKTYPTAVVAPFALLAPCTGALASALIFGESFGPVRGGGMALIVLGLAVAVISPSALRRVFGGPSG